MKTLLILIGLQLFLQPEQSQANELDWLVGCWETPNDSGKIVDEISWTAMILFKQTDPSRKQPPDLGD